MFIRQPFSFINTSNTKLFSSLHHHLTAATTSPYYHHHPPFFKPFSYIQRSKESYKQARCSRKFKNHSSFLLSTTFTPCFFPSLVLVVVTQQVDLGSTISRDALLKLGIWQGMLCHQAA
ncbi:hypothetical protein HanRHA438_Chr09g0407191 [Helianthus annuus]|nr:hypothetical protein HanRHA438_Chr09g0407191 [Helianthus annuus]